MDSIKAAINEKYRGKLMKPWSNDGGRYVNSIQIGGNDFFVVLSPRDPDGKKVTSIMVVNMFSLQSLNDREKRLRSMQDSLGWNTKTTIGTASKGVAYYDFPEFSKISTLKQDGPNHVLTTGKGDVVFNFGSRSASLNNVKIDLGGMPIVNRGQPYLPVSAFRAIGCKVSGFATGQTAHQHTFVDCGQGQQSVWTTSDASLK